MGEGGIRCVEKDIKCSHANLLTIVVVLIRRLGFCLTVINIDRIKLYLLICSGKQLSMTMAVP